MTTLAATGGPIVVQGVSEDFPLVNTNTEKEPEKVTTATAGILPLEEKTPIEPRKSLSEAHVTSTETSTLPKTVQFLKRVTDKIGSGAFQHDREPLLELQNTIWGELAKRVSKNSCPLEETVDVLLERYEKLLASLDSFRDRLKNILNGSYSRRGLDSDVGQASYKEDKEKKDILTQNFKEYQTMGKEIWLGKDGQPGVQEEVRLLTKRIEKDSGEKVSEKRIERFAYIMRKKMTKEQIIGEIKDSTQKTIEREKIRNTLTEKWNKSHKIFLTVNFYFDYVNSSFEIIPKLRDLKDSLDGLLSKVKKVRQDIAHTKDNEEFKIEFKEFTDERDVLKDKKGRLYIELQSVIAILKEKFEGKAEHEILAQNFITYNENLKKSTFETIDEVHREGTRDLENLYKQLICAWNDIHSIYLSVEEEIKLVENSIDIIPGLINLHDNFDALQKATRDKKIAETNSDNLRKALLEGDKSFKQQYENQYDLWKKGSIKTSNRSLEVIYNESVGKISARLKEFKEKLPKELPTEFFPTDDIQKNRELFLEQYEKEWRSLGENLKANKEQAKKSSHAAMVEIERIHDAIKSIPKGQSKTLTESDYSFKTWYLTPTYTPQLVNLPFS